MLTVSVGAGSQPGDDFLSLWQWLCQVPELGGALRVVPPEPESGTLGGLASELAVTLAPGGVAAPLAAVLITWLRSRRTDVVVVIRDGKRQVLEIRAKGLRQMSAEDLRRYTTDLAKGIAESSIPDRNRTEGGSGQAEA